MSITDKSKIVIIGAGNVGEAVCYTLMVRRQASEIVLVDINGDRAEGSALDIVHGTAFFHQVKVRNGGYEDCADAQIIILTAGVARKPGQTRLDLAKTNVSITRDIARRIMQYAVNPILVVVSNPVDVLTYVVQQETGLPANRVIGSGTSLDTARFRQMIGEACGVDVSNVTAYILWASTATARCLCGPAPLWPESRWMRSTSPRRAGTWITPGLRSGPKMREAP